MTRNFKTLLLAGALVAGSIQPAGAVFVKHKAETTHTSIAASPSLAGTITSLTGKRSVAKAVHKKNPLQRLGARLVSLSAKSKVAAALFAFFLGNYGVHRFYMGLKKTAFLQLGGTLLGIVLLVAGLVATSGALLIAGYFLYLGIAIWAFVDFIRILTGSLEPEDGSFD